MYRHDLDLKDYRSENGFALLTENEAIGLIALLLLIAALMDAFGVWK